MNYAAIDLPSLPKPQVVKEFTFEEILARLQQRFDQRCRELGVAFDAFLESDPAMILMQACAYEMMLNRQTSNDDARAVMLAFAEDADLEQIAANMGLQRRVIVPADPDATPPTEAVMETDESLRARVQLAPEAWSNAGTPASYVFHAMEVEGVVDAGASSPAPGQAVVTVLGHAQTTSAELVNRVYAHLAEEHIRPLTDQLAVQAASIIETGIEAELVFYPGPAVGPALAQAQERLAAYLAKIGKLGHDLRLPGIHAALHVEGVQRVELISPASDIIAGPHQAVRVITSSVRDGGQRAI